MCIVNEGVFVVSFFERYISINILKVFGFFVDIVKFFDSEIIKVLVELLKNFNII